MKKSISVLLFSFLMVSLYGQKIQVGMKAPDWKFKDAENKEYTLNTWPGKVLQINYVDPDEAELNEPFNESVNKAVDTDKKISREQFQGFGIVDTKSTWKPNGIIRSIAGKKAKKFNTTILFDYEGTLQSLWGLPKDSYSVVILDKNRIVRALYTGKIPDAENEKIIQLIQQLTKE